MEIYGIGIDILETNSFSGNTNINHLISKILTTKEQMYIQQSNLAKHNFLVISFAFKEAASKAIGTGIFNKKINLQSIELTWENDFVKDIQILGNHNEYKFKLSMTHSSTFILASVIAYRTF
ncbi:4'-phosphopantetheinyl transferase superfamily protein [Bacillus toyonensis]|uniref:4'-phosphopantetheinyl transferase superfamily protein n=1 Tax=Bacillus toyonensis TaxID=155322 RepID=UPI0018D15023|nr:4'-phosphopantetheinyl transferase superfamily protein [Bacillus toyonensis]MBH0357136.1 hypothetical protein [Bacillus toyonensis biovar Thuringiensis]